MVWLRYLVVVHQTFFALTELGLHRQAGVPPT
jgi:hypothetical protein